MKRKRSGEARNDFFYAFVMFAMFAVMVFNVVAEFFHREGGVYFAQVAEAVRPRADPTKADAHAVAAARSA